MDLHASDDRARGQDPMFPEFNCFVAFSAGPFAFGTRLHSSAKELVLGGTINISDRLIIYLPLM
jgi:hypothetical protein